MDVGIVGLLRGAWLVGIIPILMAWLPINYGINHSRRMLVFLAGFGKTIKASSTLYKFSVPLKFVTHFYVLAIIWTSLLLLATWSYAHELGSYSGIASFLIGGSPFLSDENNLPISQEHIYHVWRSVFLLLLMEIQVIRRFAESVLMFNYSSKARTHIAGYFTGLFFYTAAPLSLCCNYTPELYTYITNSLAEFMVKGKYHASPFGIQCLEYLGPLVTLGWCQWVGAIVFFWGWVHQRRCHAILGNLREVKEEGDKIPYGDWFDSVSSADSLAEMVIFAGILVASGGLDMTIWLLFAFVVTNLAFSAGEVHKWYHRKYEDYPCNRYAVLPFIY